MRHLLVIATAAVLAAGVVAAPAAARTDRIAVHCDETRVSEWIGGVEWTDEDFVYHVRGGTATYVDVGSPYCAGLNTATVELVNLDVMTGNGIVMVSGHRELSAFDGGWDAMLLAHFTPDGPYIWEGQVVGHGYGALEGYQYRSVVYETSHETVIEDGFVFLPGH